MRNLHLVPDHRKTPEATPEPDSAMLDLMGAFQRALLRQRYLPPVPLPQDDDPLTALGGRATRKPFVRRQP
jgi:hypothetical protein